jgi:hypothetical protein
MQERYQEARRTRKGKGTRPVIGALCVLEDQPANGKCCVEMQPACFVSDTAGLPEDCKAAGGCSRRAGGDLPSASEPIVSMQEASNKAGPAGSESTGGKTRGCGGRGRRKRKHAGQGRARLGEFGVGWIRSRWSGRGESWRRAYQNWGKLSLSSAQTSWASRSRSRVFLPSFCVDTGVVLRFIEGLL